MTVQSEAADRVVRAIKQDRRAGLAKSWMSVTVLLDEFRLTALTPETCHVVTSSLAAAGASLSPDLATAKRQSKIRLLLEGEGPERVQDLVAEGLVTATLWKVGSRPRPVSLADQPADADDGFLWVDVRPSAEVPAVLALLGPLLKGLTEEAVEDLVQVDDLPGAVEYGDTHKVSTVIVHAVEPENVATGSVSKAGSLVVQTVELLVGPDWLVSCWHEPRTTPASPVSTVPVDRSVDQQQSLAGVAQCWMQQGHVSVGALGLLLFRELGRSYTSAHRTLHSWLEQWELEFHREGAAMEQQTLQDLRVLVSEFQRRLNSLNESRLVVADHSWFPGTGHTQLDKQFDGALTRAIDGLHSLSGMLRSGVDLLTTAGIREQLRLAEASSTRAGQLQDQFGLVASVLLVPTLIAGLFGANTAVPGQGHWSGFVVMLALMALGSCLTYLFFRSVKTRTLSEAGPGAGDAAGEGWAVPTS